MKSIRVWVYAIMKYENTILVIKKWRGPFTWMYDLPGGKIEHWERNIDSLKREIFEEIWLHDNDFKIEKILSVEEDFIQHIYEWEIKDEHIIAIIYLVNIINNNFDKKYVEKWWDANGFIAMNIQDSLLPKTPILKKALDQLK